MFKTEFGEAAAPSDPESLFRDLRRRAPEIKHLWAHQADLLREYASRYVDVRDVAIELPTGAGKTLVGLLIGEWRRRAFRQRVAYLCPTRQLARQAGGLASRYGIGAHVLVGRQDEYPPQEFAAYQTGDAIAITTYSSVFNINPRIDDATTLILDDAHAGEDYVADMWSVEIWRAEQEALYNSLVQLLQQGIPAAYLADLRDPTGGQLRGGDPELVPGNYVRIHQAAIIELLDENLPEGTPPWFAWGLVREHISACNLFVSWSSFLLRPLIPPTLSHPPFEQASQRVYMSATLGAGGELERITGIQCIARLPMPADLDRRGTGRRLFLLPQVSLQDDKAEEVIRSASDRFDRVLAIAPSRYEADALIGLIAGSIDDIMFARDIEDSLDPFIERKGVVLVLNRYDGLDLPGDACRALILSGLPRGTNLQERFLWARAGAFSLLRDRILTRFTQGVGRCTRSDNDYAVVILWGRDLVDYILKKDNRRVLIPELQAELEFGIENSKDRDVDGFGALCDAFMAQEEEWQEAERALVSLRASREKEPDPVSERLLGVVQNEVAYVYALWEGNYEKALELSRAVADNLGGDETKGYRAWWYYLAADAAHALSTSTGDGNLLIVHRDLLARASACSTAIGWFSKLARIAAVQEPEAGAEDPWQADAAKHIQDVLTRLGSVGTGFEKYVREGREALESDDHGEFQRGLLRLGFLLGFRSEIPEGQAAPDCIWSIGDDLYIVHEVKLEQSPEGAIGVNDVRQASSHQEWITGNKPTTESARVLCLIESPRQVVAKEAIAYARSLYYVNPTELRDLFERATKLLRTVRSMAPDLSEEGTIERIYQGLSSSGVRPVDICREMTLRPVAEMPVTE